MNTRIEVRQGSLTDGRETVLVNASNTNVILGGGVSAAIKAACGLEFQEHIARALVARFDGPMPPGEVLITDAGEHPHARFVAHVAVMDYRPTSSEDASPSPERIRRGCTNLWNALEALPGREPLSVAMVALGAGVGGLGVRTSTELACETLQEHLARHPDSRLERVVFYGYQRDEFAGIVDVVSSRFPIDESSVPREIWERVHSMRRG
jgi:O-acetyl-ADP-ribose deacetylase (regulator of RNase III)